MSLFCSFSLFVMGKLFLRKVKFYGSCTLPVKLAWSVVLDAKLCSTTCIETVVAHAEGKRVPPTDEYLREGSHHPPLKSLAWSSDMKYETQRKAWEIPPFPIIQ